MALPAFNIGKETNVILTHPRFGPIAFALLTNFEARPQTTRQQSQPITNNGENVYRVTYQGWEGTFELDRTDDLVDTLFQLLEDNYYAGAPESYFLITQTIRNPDGSISDYRYRNVVVTPETPGAWSGDTKVTQRFTWMATKREKV